MNIKTIFKSKKTIIVCLAVVLAIIVLLCVVFSGSGSFTGKTETSLKKILAAESLSTVEYTYNSIATVSEKEEIKYYVAYKGLIKAGFDFDKIDVKDKNKKITITIPEIEITSVTVDTNMDYMFIKKKYDKENTYQEAYSACERDIIEEASNNQTLYKMAEESAVETIKALIKPWEKNLKKGYSVEIKCADK